MLASDLHNEQKESSARGSSVYVLSVIAVFILGILIAVSWYLYREQQKQTAIQERQRFNEDLGLSRDFPSDRVPIYAGLEILLTDRGLAESTAGEPMDKWYIHGQIDEEKDVLYQYYHQRFIDSGMRQTQYISIPTGYGIDYADEEMSVEAIIEYRQDSELLQVELTVYRLR